MWPSRGDLLGSESPGKCFLFGKGESFRGPFCCTVVFAVVWLFFFANRLHLYFLIADGCLLILVSLFSSSSRGAIFQALCVFLCCSDYRFGTPVDRQLGDARSRLFWTTCFVVLFLAFYACVEIFYPPKGAPFLLNQLRGLQYVFLMIGVVLLLPPYRDILFCRKEPMRPEEDPSYMRNTESSVSYPPTYIKFLLASATYSSLCSSNGSSLLPVQSGRLSQLFVFLSASFAALPGYGKRSSLPYLIFSKTLGARQFDDPNHPDADNPAGCHPPPEPLLSPSVRSWRILLRAWVTD